jgi:hypothetical protein
VDSTELERFKLRDAKRRAQWSVTIGGHRCRADAQRRETLYKKNNYIRRTYGINLKTYMTIVKKQNGKCAICREKKKFVVDHDHKTGAVRGLLCNSCNVGLGHFQDNQSQLANAILYLQGY